MEVQPINVLTNEGVIVPTNATTRAVGCVACHLMRGVVNAGQVVECTNVTLSTVYNVLARLRNAEVIINVSETQGPGAVQDYDLMHTTELGRAFAAASSVPLHCPKAAAQATSRAHLDHPENTPFI